jgi:serine/threonine protein kinase
VLFEMLTGRQLFGGETVSDTIAAVLMSEPDFTVLPPDTPPNVRELLVRCLARDLKERLRDIGEARHQLEHPSSPSLNTSSRKYVSPEQLAPIYASLGEKDQAFAWLDKAFEARSAWLITGILVLAQIPAMVRPSHVLHQNSPVCVTYNPLAQRVRPE